jgi:hypothetical protein
LCSGSEYFQGKDYETSIKLFEASMLYLLDGSNDGNNTMQRAKSLRVLCLCHLALMQFDRAAEVLQQAEKVQHGYAGQVFKNSLTLEAPDHVSRQLSKNHCTRELLIDLVY